MYLGKDDGSEVKVKDVSESELNRDLLRDTWGVIAMTVFSFVWLIAVGVFYFTGVSRIADVNGFVLSIWALVGITFVSYMVIGTVSNVTGIGFLEMVAAYGLLSVLSVCEGMEQATLIAVSVGIGILVTFVTAMYKMLMKNNLHRLTRAPRSKR